MAVHLAYLVCTVAGHYCFKGFSEIVVSQFIHNLALYYLRLVICVIVYWALLLV